MKSSLAQLAVAALVLFGLLLGMTLTAQAQDDYSPILPTGTVEGPGLTGDEILAGIQQAAADEAAAAAAAAAGGTDEVLGVSVTSSDQLAFTGSTVNTPLAVGSVMIGAGGLLLLVARKRDQLG